MIDAIITGIPELQDKMKRLPEVVRKHLRVAITDETSRLKTYIKTTKLSGQVLKVKTGNLRRSIDNAVMDTDAGVVGTVGTNVEYAAAHEYGFHGTQTVREHIRTVKQAWGKPIEATQATVKQHTRQVNLPIRSFLRSALAERQADIRKNLDAAVKKGLADLSVGKGS